MIKKGTLVLIALVIGMVCIAGCTSDNGGATPTLTPTSTETPVAPTQGAPDLKPQPTDVVPTTKSVTVAASKDPITGDITVSFRGGKGQLMVNDVKIEVISGTGTRTTKYIDLKAAGDKEAVFRVDDGEATRGEDRVIATVSFNDGTRYKVYDTSLTLRGNA
jgi:hypothetical protein